MLLFHFIWELAVHQAGVEDGGEKRGTIRGGLPQLVDDHHFLSGCVVKEDVGPQVGDGLLNIQVFSFFVGGLN